MGYAAHIHECKVGMGICEEWRWRDFESSYCLDFRKPSVAMAFYEPLTQHGILGEQCTCTSIAVFQSARQLCGAWNVFPQHQQ